MVNVLLSPFKESHCMVTAGVDDSGLRFHLTNSFVDIVGPHKIRPQNFVKILVPNHGRQMHDTIYTIHC